MAIVAGIFLVRPGFVTSLDYKVCDLLTGWAAGGRQSGRVALVEIDEQSLGRFGRWPWPRDMLGALVKRVADAGAATVALDMILSEEDRGTPAKRTGTAPAEGTNDDVLAAALASVPAVAGYSFRFDEDVAAAPGCSPPTLPLVVAGPEDDAGKAFFRASGVECMVPGAGEGGGGQRVFECGAGPGWDAAGTSISHRVPGPALSQPRFGRADGVQAHLPHGVPDGRARGRVVEAG